MIAEASSQADDRRRALSRWAGLVLLFAAGTGISALIVLKGMQPNDEGLMLSAVARIADGEVPYRDFWWFYPPGQPYLLAGIWEVFGPSLVGWRVVRVLTNGGVALLVYLLARREAPRGVALAAWAVAAVSLAAPTGPHPYPLTLLFALGALMAFDRSPVLAGVLTGVASVFRLELAAYLGAGIVLGYLLRGAQRRVAAIGRYAGAAVGVGAALFAPVVLEAGLSTSWDLLIRYPIEDFSDYQSLPFPLVYGGATDFSSVDAARTTIGAILSFEVPLLLMLDLAAVLAVLALGPRSDYWRRAPVAVFAIGTAHYLVTRPDAFHVAPLAVTLAVPSAWVIGHAIAALRRTAGQSTGGSLPDRVRRLPPRARLALIPLPVIALVPVWLLADGLQRVERQVAFDMVRVRLDVADGVRELPVYSCSLPGSTTRDLCTLRDLEATVHYVRGRVPPGSPIYVGTRRADLVTSGAPLIYVLAGRPNATRYDIAAPGVVTSSPVQREIVGDLERRGRPLVVRWTAPITAAPEDNAAGRPSGVRILDSYLARNYRPAERFGSYLILEGRS
ncbi:MAG TPA: hypothetical protein VFQ12_08080 [Thermoleophilaceae bacterium]|nr:hypothetical protein [Thermoleophilaceae bacterium]